MKVETRPNFVYVMITTEDRYIEKQISQALLTEKLKLHSTSLASSCLHIYDTFYLGYIYRSSDPKQEEHFTVILRETLQSDELGSVKKSLAHFCHHQWVSDFFTLP